MIDLVEYLHDIADDQMGLEPEDRLILGECAARITELEAEKVIHISGAKKRTQYIAELETQLEAVIDLLFGTDEQMKFPVNLDALNTLFRKLRAAAIGEGEDE